MSIYEEKTGADVGAGRLHQSSGVGFGDVGGDDRDGGGSGEPELVVPDYGGGVDAGGNDVEPATATELSAPDTDPSARIAGFKAKREKRETWGLTIVLNVLVVMYVGPQLLAKGDPDVNPLKEYVNGTEQWQWTEAGSYVYAAIWPVVHVADAAIVSSGLQLEDVVAKFQWSAVAACQVPATSVLLWIYFSVAQVMTILTLYAGYGWPCGVLFGAMWLRFLVVGGLCFAREPVEPNARNILMRRPTAYEHRIMMEMTFMVGYVVPFDFYCINEGQWDGKTAGRAGAMLMVFLELAWVALWWSKWGRDGLLAAGAPRVAKSEGKSREDRFADALLFGLLTYPVHGLLHCVFLLPDIPSNDELVTMEGSLRLVDGWWRFCWSQSPIIIVFICFRKQIFGVLKVSLQNKQRLQDGAFIAALLVDDGVDDLIYEATELFRAVPFSKITADLLRSSKGTNADYALSQPCKLNSVDFFVSHSWSDDADQKYARLSVVAAEFQRKHGREPIIWLDKLCIDQDNINRALRCLPVFVFSCNRLLILAGNTYCDRLWCVWELYVFFSTSGTRALDRVELHDFSDAGTSSLFEFDVANAHCFSPVDEAKLRGIIESGGTSDFNSMIREVGLELQKATTVSK